MSIEVNRRIIDYIIDQAEIYDGRNLDIEHSIIHRIEEYYNRMSNNVMSILQSRGDMDSLIKYQNIINRAQNVIEIFYSDSYKLIVKSVEEHMIKGYIDFQQLIEIGHELEGKIQQMRITEMRGSRNKKIGTMPDSNAIEFMRKHAFEQVKGFSDDILTQMKARLGQLYVQNSTDRRTVRDAVEQILETNYKRANMISQTELSMAYNSGALERMSEYNSMNNIKLRKYWHGFKYSKKTCRYCRPRIGRKYDLEDNTEHLPAHPRCRCVWLPYREDWNEPISTIFTRNADMLKRVYSPDDIYRRMNERLGIRYADYLDIDNAVNYLNGDRSDRIRVDLEKAREKAIKDKISSFEIAKSKAESKLSNEFNIQMHFWKKYVAGGIVDNNENVLRSAYEAIKGVMILPWNGRQLSLWNKLLDTIEEYV